MSYVFPPGLERLIQDQLATGQYSSHDEVLIDAMHALAEAREREFDSFRAEIQQRLTAADADPSSVQPLDFEKLIAEESRRWDSQQ